MKFKNKMSITGYTKANIAGLNEANDSIGIHLIGPISETNLISAIYKAINVGYSHITLHTSKPLRTYNRVYKVLEELNLLEK